MTREDAERLKYGLWPKVEEELDVMIHKSESSLRTVSAEGLKVIQERIKTLEQIKGLPDRVIEHHSPDE